MFMPVQAGSEVTEWLLDDRGTGSIGPHDAACPVFTMF